MISDRRRNAIVPGMLLALILSGCVSVPAAPPSQPIDAAATRDTHEQLHAVLWMQTAAEYRALSLQSFQSAERAMTEALADRDWTAAVEQTGAYGALPPAVIVDVDETMLDNSAYQARLVRTVQPYSTATWTAWVEEEAATAIPGALEFARAAAQKGVKVFYVTNRKAIEEASTRRNLVALGFPLPADEDVVLVRGERPEWDASDKTSRRSHVASRYRVLLQIGDNLGDFINDAKATVADRFAAADKYRSYWGRRWFMIPNPAYGHWEAALLDHRYDRPDAEQLRIKRERLNDGGNPVD